MRKVLGFGLILVGAVVLMVLWLPCAVYELRKRIEEKEGGLK